MLLALAAAGLLAGGGSLVRGCGLNWLEPKSHFDGVSNQGYVFLVETLGDITLRDGKALPMRAIFRSESNTASPYLGHGWELPLLESHIVQLDERWFRVVEPTGWYRFFWRDAKDPTVLHGQNNWKGVIRGNGISVMADCGDRLDFRDGRIVSMDLKGQKLQVERSADGMATLKDGSSILLAVQKGLSKEGLEIRLGNGEMLGITQAACPLIEVIGGRAVIGRKVESLGTITRGNGEKRTWEYAVDEKLRPSLKQGDRLITWNPTTRRILTDAGWTYDIKPGEGPRDDNAVIGRANAQGQKEFWHHDRAKGEEIVQGIDGVKKVTTWFTSGVLNRKLRKIFETKVGNSEMTYSASYSGSGRLLREHMIRSGRNFDLVYDSQGRVLRKAIDEDFTILYTYLNADERLPSTVKYTSDGVVLSFARDVSGKMIVIADQIKDSYKNFHP